MCEYFLKPLFLPQKQALLTVIFFLNQSVLKRSQSQIMKLKKSRYPACFEKSDQLATMACFLACAVWQQFTRVEFWLPTLDKMGVFLLLPIVVCFPDYEAECLLSCMCYSFPLIEEYDLVYVSLSKVRKLCFSF